MSKSSDKNEGYGYTYFTAPESPEAPESSKYAPTTPQEAISNIVKAGPSSPHERGNKNSVEKTDKSR